MRTPHKDSVGVCTAQARIECFGLTFFSHLPNFPSEGFYLAERESIIVRKQPICTNLEEPKEPGSILSAVKQFRSAQ